MTANGHETSQENDDLETEAHVLRMLFEAAVDGAHCGPAYGALTWVLARVMLANSEGDLEAAISNLETNVLTDLRSALELAAETEAQMALVGPGGDYADCG